jgi:hypothetical protein
MVFAGAVHKTTKEIQEMRRLIAQGLLPPDAIEQHLKDEEMSVFGENVRHDSNGAPIEMGKGSKAQPTFQSVQAYKKYAKNEPAYEETLARMEQALAAYEAQQTKNRGNNRNR